jgi:hypothetical protein
MREMLRSAVGLIAAPRVPSSVSFIGKLILVPLLLLMFAALAMEGGAWRRYIAIAGPFAAETSPAHSLMLSVPDQGPVPWWQQPLNYDSLEKPYESRLHLSIDGREMWPAHSNPEQIRKGETEGFSHWESGVIFSLPPGVMNAPDTIATLRYNIKPRPLVTLILLLASLTLGWLCYHEPIKELAHRHWQPTSAVRRGVERVAAALLPAPYLILFGLCCLGLVGCVLFVGSSLYALVDGWALPTMAPIRWFPIMEWAARNEPHFGQLLLMLAGFGALTTWLAVLLRKGNPSLDYEMRLRGFLLYCGFPIVACALVLCTSAMWNGMIRPGDQQWANLGGLVPFSDAHGHLSSAYYQARDGTWIEFAARRPLAAAFREVLLVASDYSPTAMLILQAALLALAACIASYAVMAWRGIWSGLAFLGFTYIYVRSFAPTPLTEALGLFWALLSIPFFVKAFRTGLIGPALVGLAMTAVALMIRMGSMFTIPALLLWLVWQFGCDVRSRVKAATLAIGVLIAVFGVNYLLQKSYGPPGAGTGSNFSYTLCGLAIGTTWDGCPKRLAEQGRSLQGDEVTVAKQLYAFAWENFQARPSIFLGRLVGGADEFAKSFPVVIWRGYDMGVNDPNWLFRRAWLAVSLIGLVFLALRRAKTVEISFWALLWASVVASGAFVYYDAGARVLAASHPLIALFVAMGLVNPEISAFKEERSEGRLGCSFGALALVISAISCVFVPWVAHRSYSQRSLDFRLAKDEAYVAGGRRMSGFLVVPDGAPLRTNVASVHFSDFEVLLKQANLEPMLQPVAPFGFAFAPRLEKDVITSDVFLVPPEVLERRDVELWHFKLDFGRGAAEVTSAEPIQR